MKSNQKQPSITGRSSIRQELFPNAANWYALYLSIVKGWSPGKAIEYMLGYKIDDNIDEENNKNIKTNNE